MLSPFQPLCCFRHYAMPMPPFSFPMPLRHYFAARCHYARFSLRCRHFHIDADAFTLMPPSPLFSLLMLIFAASPPDYCHCFRYTTPPLTPMPLPYHFHLLMLRFRRYRRLISISLLDIYSPLRAMRSRDRHYVFAMPCRHADYAAAADCLFRCHFADYFRRLRYYAIFADVYAIVFRHYFRLRRAFISNAICGQQPEVL
jgi:hypothetical protein